jgi:hypothetical protein
VQLFGLLALLFRFRCFLCRNLSVCSNFREPLGKRNGLNLLEGEFHRVQFRIG